MREPMQRAAWRAWLLVLALLLARPAHAQTAELRIAAVERNAVSWVAGQLLAEVYREAGLRLKLLPMPASRANLLATSGQVDGELIRISSYAERHPQLLRVEPALYRIALVAYSLPGRSAQVRTRDDLRHYTVGTLRGLTTGMELTEGHPSVTLTLNPEQMFRMLQANRFDLALETPVGGGYALNRLGIKDLVVSPELIRFELYHHIAERHRALLPRLQDALLRLRSSGELDRLAARYEAEVLKIDLEQWGEPRPARP